VGVRLSGNRRARTSLKSSSIGTSSSSDDLHGTTLGGLRYSGRGVLEYPWRDPATRRGGRSRGVLHGYSMGTSWGTQGYSKGTQGYSKGTQGYSKGTQGTPRVLTRHSKAGAPLHGDDVHVRRRSDGGHLPEDSTRGYSRVLHATNVGKRRSKQTNTHTETNTQTQTNKRPNGARIERTRTLIR
jgi:hypothetical protein